MMQKRQFIKAGKVRTAVEAITSYAFDYNSVDDEGNRCIKAEIHSAYNSNNKKDLVLIFYKKESAERLESILDAKFEIISVFDEEESPFQILTDDFLK